MKKLALLLLAVAGFAFASPAFAQIEGDDHIIEGGDHIIEGDDH